MNKEIEVTFMRIDVPALQQRLRNIGASLQYARTFMKRKVYDHESFLRGTYLRVRDEGDCVTMTLKKVTSEGSVDGVFEHEVVVSDFETTCNILSLSGLRLKSYQETRREKWQYKHVEIVIDEWPGLSPYVEIEGSSEEEIKEVSEVLGFDYNEGVFGTVALVAEKELGLSRDYVNSLPEITFDAPLTKKNII